MVEPLQLFASQRKIYPRRVWGKFRKLKWVAMVALLSIYYLAPWIRWDRGPHVPDQAILIDMVGRRGYFFFLEIWPQEVYYLTGILILAAVGLFFVTSLFGRVWCGYACPQTVWTDLFVWVERIVQGDRNARKRLDDSRLLTYDYVLQTEQGEARSGRGLGGQAPQRAKRIKINFEKIWKKGLTHALWLVIGLFTGGAWVFYFNDAPTLMDQILHMNVPWDVGGWILGLTFSTYLMAGYAREQVCTYMCPYARFQSAMFDPDTLIIAYDEKRGEPRGKHKAGESWEGKGHCIDCDSCVVVCPMGIDIRNGLQMECIACGLCVDACDNVMEKISLPKGLIRYDTERGTKFTALRPRTFWYAGIISLVGALMLYGLLTRSELGINVIHDRNPLFVMLSDGSIRNGYIVHILNKTHEDREYALTVSGLENAQMRIEGNQPVELERIKVFADSTGNFRVFVNAPAPKEPRIEISFQLTETESKLTDNVKTIFVSANQ